MIKLWSLLLDIALLRRGPQDMPGDSRSTVLLAVLYTTLSVIVAGLYYPASAAIGMALADTALLAFITRITLLWRRRAARFMQTFAALLGVGVLLGALNLPLAYSFQHAAAAGTAALPSVLLLVLLAWQIAVYAHILRHAWALPFPVGVAGALLYVFVSWQLGSALAPAPAAG